MAHSCSFPIKAHPLNLAHKEVMVHTPCVLHAAVSISIARNKDWLWRGFGDNLGMLWEAIGYVSGGFTLVAFLTAAATWAYRASLLNRVHLIQSATDSERSRLVEDVLDVLHVDTARLTRDQQFQIAMERLRQRAVRFQFTAIVVAFIAVLAAFVAIVALLASITGGRESLLVPLLDDLTLTIRYDSMDRIAEASIEDVGQVRFEYFGEDRKLKRVTKKGDAQRELNLNFHRQASKAGEAHRPPRYSRNFVKRRWYRQAEGLCN